MSSTALLRSRFCAQLTNSPSIAARLFSRFGLVALFTLATWGATCEAQWTWSRTGGTRNWESGGSWSGNNQFPNSLTAIANINNNITSDQIIVLNSSASVGTIYLGDSTASSGVFQNFTIQSANGTQALSLGSGGIFSSNSVNTISAATKLGASTLIQHSTAAGALHLNGTIDLGSFTLTVTGAGTTSIAGSINGTGGLVKTGAGNLILGGTNIYTGGTTVSAGSITGNSSSLQGSISNNSTVIFNQATAGTWSGSMKGTGSLVKTGSGNLILAGTNTYSGGTTVSDGILTGSTSSLQGAITNKSSVVFDQAVNGTYFGSMSGNGSLTKLGNGNLTLAANNNFTGGTTVSAGTLTGNSASLQGSITNNSTVVFDQSVAGIYLGTMTGTGSLIKAGTGNLALAGANSYSGGTTISAGKLTGTTNSLQGSIVNNSLIEFSQSANGTFSGIITGSGSLIKSGSGMVTVANAQGYLGDTVVAGGTLRLGIGATLASSRVQIDAGAVLDVSQFGSFVLTTGQTVSGSGQVIGSLIQSAGSAIAPGASPGTLSTSGDMTWNGGASYLWEINDATGVAGNSTGWDLISTTGSLIIAATGANPYVIQVATLLPSNAAGDVANLDPNSNYEWVIAIAAGGITGFDSTAFTVDTSGFTNDLSSAPWHSFVIRQAGNTLVLRYAFVPEPKISLVAGLFAIGLALARQRRQSD